MISSFYQSIVRIKNDCSTVVQQLYNVTITLDLQSTQQMYQQILLGYHALQLLWDTDARKEENIALLIKNNALLQNIELAGQRISIRHAWL